MASWLKVAEDLFEVVDRRAKLVASELTEEQSESEPSASKGQETQARRAKPKHKAQSRRSSIDLRRSSTDVPRINTTGDQSTAETSLPRDADDKIQASQSDNLVEVPIITKETSSDPPVDVTEDTSQTTAPSFSSAKIPQKDSGEDAPSKVKELSVSVDNLDSGTSKIGDSSLENSKDGVDDPSYIPAEDNAESTNGDHTADANRKDSSANNDPSLKVDEKKNDSGKVDSSNVSTLQANDADLVLEYPSNLKKLHEHQIDTSPMRVQDQLDEAQGLLKTAVSTGQSKEARLARVCAGLSSRLQEYKSENAQLEELLVAERELSTSYQAHIKQLQKELTASKSEVARVESSMSGALAAKNAEIEALLNSVDALKKQAAASEGKLLSLQENMEVVMRSRELTETRMMQALREELASAERRAEEERTAHNATKMAAVEREVELEHRAVEASNALARMQRSADESTSRAAELEHKVALLEVECSSLTQELQEMEARARRGQKKTSEEANQILQMQAWQEEAERARQGQRDAESKLSSLEAEMQKMRVEMAGMRRDAEHYSRHEHMELEKRYRELTDLLYHKQTQLEAMASEKAAAEFQLEKELRRLQEAQVEVERSRSSRRASSPWEEDSDLKTLEPLPLHHRHIAGARIQLEKAAKLLDSGAVRATRFLWRYPYARVILLFYLVFVHLFLMYLLHHLQEQADTFSASEVAASMGLRNSSLP